MISIQRLGIAVLVTLMVIFGIYRWGFHKGWSERDVEMQAEIAKKNEESRKTEIKLNEQIHATSVQLSEANNAINQKQSALDRAIRAGRVRISAPSCVPAAADPALAGGDRDKAGSQPDRPVDQPSDAERETLAAIAAIVAEGDRNTHQLNACITAYNQVREQLNGPR